MSGAQSACPMGRGFFVAAESNMIVVELDGRKSIGLIARKGWLI